MRKQVIWGLALFASLFLTAIKTNAQNKLSDEERKTGFKLIFDGKTTSGWHLYNKGKVRSVWKAVNGELKCSPGGNDEHGDLVTDQVYTNYELRFDWKISKAGNSGVFINVLERKEIPTAWTSGPEYQLLEKSHQDYEKEMKRPGCLYNFAKQLHPVEANSSGWNHSVIIQKDGIVRFYLNGVQTAEQDFTSEEWKKAITMTSFKNFPEFGKYTSGRIALQDWNKGVSFSNIRIKEL